MYLFTIQNCDFLINEINDFKKFEIDYIWGKVNDNFQYLIEIKEKSFIKSEIFFSLISNETIRNAIEKFLGFIQNIIQIKIVSNDELNKIIGFEFHLKEEKAKQNSRMSFEVERSLNELMLWTYDHISDEYFFRKDDEKSIVNFKVQNTNELQLIKCIEESISKELFIPQSIYMDEDTYYNIELAKFEKKQTLSKIILQGSFLLYDELSNYKECILQSCLKKKTLLFIKNDECLQEWIIQAKTLHIDFLVIKCFEDFKTITFSSLQSSHVIFVSVYDEIEEDLEFYKEEIRQNIQTLFNKNIYIANKNKQVEQIDINDSLSKRFIYSLEKKFPFTSIPLQWIEFDQIFMFENGNNTFIKHFLQFYQHDSWIWLYKEIENENEFTFQALALQEYKDIFFKMPLESYIHKHLPSIIKQHSILIPISKLIKLKLIPLYLYFSLYSYEDKFLTMIEQVYDYSLKDTNILQVKNLRNIKIKNILLELEDEDALPFNLYEIMKREKPMEKQKAIENFEFHQGKSFYSLFLEWKFDIFSNSSSKYNDLKNNEIQQCLICFDSLAKVYSVCGHGFCCECKQQLLKMNTTLFCVCPICRENLSFLDWIEIEDNVVETETTEDFISSKLKKLYLEIQKSQEKKILCIVPDDSQLKFQNYFMSKNIFCTLETDALENEYEWKCIVSEKFLSEHSKLKLNPTIIYYISPEYNYFKNIYKFILLNSKFFNANIKLFFVVSNHTQETKTIEKILKIL